MSTCSCCCCCCLLSCLVLSIPSLIAGLASAGVISLCSYSSLQNYHAGKYMVGHGQDLSHAIAMYLIVVCCSAATGISCETPAASRGWSTSTINTSCIIEYLHTMCSRLF
jgi:hypothetical protein